MQEKSMNNNKGGEGKNEIKQSIMERRTEIKKAIRGFPRVDSVECFEGDTNTVTTIRKVHLSKLREPVAKLEQVSPLPKKDEYKDKDEKKEHGGSGEEKTKKDAIDKPKEKLEEDKMKSMESPVITTAILKVHLHCDCVGCTKKIQKVVTKTNDLNGVLKAFTAIGYHQMGIDRANGLVTVRGSMDMNVLAKSLERQLKRDVEIVPLLPEKEDEKKEKSGDDHEEKDGGERETGGEGGLDDQKTEKSSGVESVQGGVGDTHKPMIIGKENPVSHPTTVKQNKYKKVHKVSLLPEKDEDKNNNKEKGSGIEENKKQKAKDKSKEKNLKEPRMTTAVLKVHLYCNCIGCTEKIQKLVTNTIGYDEMTIDNAVGLVTVRGSMDMKVLAESLKQQLKKDVEIVPPKNDSEKKKKSGSEECGVEGKTGCESGRAGDKESEKKEKSGCEKEMNGGERKAGDGSGSEKVEQYQYPYYSHASEMFSDENPNSCSIL
ncbi:unnamed protein product [Ilex paraguariensis]|uniref:HMA domain-containing protein n=1 Tax=Ilex paraguariensis TaxID=185542 RepID=A0ABC8SNT0_9AQUA